MTSAAAPVAGAPADQLAQFLSAWFHASTFADGLYIEPAVLPVQPLRFCGTVERATATIRALDAGQRRNVYFGLHPRASSTGSGKGGIGNDTDVAGLAGLAADLDCHGAKSKHKSIDEACAAIRERLPVHLQPAILVESGHGVWAFWPFGSLLPVERHDEYKSIGQRLAALLGGDDVYDKRRIARAVGTLNWRDPCNPVRSKLIHIDGRRFALEDFDAHLPAATMPKRTRGIGAPLPSALAPRATRVVEALKLEAQEIRSRDGALRVIKILDVCPACHAEHEPGTARLTLIGALRCWRETCPAKGDGLALEEWVQRFAPAALPALAGLAPAAPSSRLTFEQAEQQLPALIREAADFATSAPGNIAVVVTPPGLGKSFATMRHLATVGAGTFASESHAALDEREHEAQQLGLTARRRYRGLLRVLDVTGAPACVYAKELAPFAERGEQLRSTACMGCQHRDNYQGQGTMCPAFAAASGKGCSFVTHAHLPLLAIEGEIRQPLFVDEQPELLQTVRIPVGELVTQVKKHYRDPWCMARVPAAQLVERAALEIWRQAPVTSYPTRVSGADIFRALVSAAGGEQALINIVGRLETAHANNPNAPRPSGQQLRSGKCKPEEWPRHDYDRILLGTLAEGVRQTGRSRSCLVVQHKLPNRPPEIFVEWRASTLEWRDRDGAPISAVLLDATGVHTDASFRAALPGRTVKHFKLEVADPPHAERVYLQFSGLTRRNLLDGTKLSERGQSALERALHEVERELPDGKQRIGVITHKPIADMLRDCIAVITKRDLSARKRIRAAKADGALKILRRWTREDRETRVLHYQGQRGSNALKDVDVLALLGDPHPEVGASHEEARVLGVDAQLHVDGVTRAEVVQAIGRARAIRRKIDQPLRVIYVGRQAPAGWTANATTVRALPSGGSTPAKGVERAAQLARRTLAAWGATSPALVRLCAKRPSLAAALGGGITSIELSYVAKISDRNLQRAFANAGGHRVSTATPTGRGRWAWWEIEPGAARKMLAKI